MLRHAFLAVALVIPAMAWADGKTQATCEGGLCCDEWAMDVRDAAGKTWGLAVGATPDEVRDRFSKSAAIDKSFCRFFGKESPCSRYEHVSAGPLRCVGGGTPVNPDPADLCANDLKNRIDRLEQRFEAQTQRLKTTQKVIETIRISASAITPASGFGQPLQALGSFGVALNDAGARARRLGEAVSLACLKPTLDAVDDTGPLLWAGGTYGVASVTMPELYGPAWADGGFGGAAERDDDAAELLRRLADLERVAATELPKLPLETVAIAEDASAIVSSADRKGTGRMVLADLGVIDGSRELAMSEVTAVFVFADNDGGARLGTVSVTRKKTGKGTVITLVGRGGGGSETIVIRVERAEKPADKPTVPGPKQASLPVGPPALGTCAGFYRAYMQQNPGQAAINPAHVQFYDEIDGKTCKPLGLTCYAYPSREMDALLPKLHAAGRKGTAGTIWNTNGFYACMPAPQPTR